MTGLRTAATLAATAAGAAIVAGGLRWRRGTRRAVARLLEAAPPPVGGTGAEAASTSLDDLPAPVVRYLAFALPASPSRIRRARIRWAGEFRMRRQGGWRPFTAEQECTVWPPGFVWDARIRLMPLLAVRVRDGYVAGRGTMLGSVGGFVTIADAGGTPEMAAGALARWLGEAVWFPTALLPGGVPGRGIRWEPLDDDAARATVADGGTTVSAEFHFAPTGQITRMTAMRYRDVAGTGVLTPFEGRYDDFARRAGVMVPTSAEVAWLLPEGRFAYWRGRPVEIAYDPAPTGR